MPKKQSKSETNPNTKPSSILDGLISSIVEEVHGLPNEPKHIAKEPLLDKAIAANEKRSKSKKKATSSEVATIPIEVPVVVEDSTIAVIPEQREIQLTVPSQSEVFGDLINNVSGMNLTPDEIEKVTGSLLTISGSHANVVRLCDPKKCSIVEVCPFTAIKKYPCGKLCPVDKCMADYAHKEYERFVREQTNNLDEELTYLELATIREIVECDLEDFRARGYSNKEDMIIKQPIFVVKDSGEIVYSDVENPIFNVRERTARRKNKLLQRLLLTPESKARFKLDSQKQKKKDTKSIIDSAELKVKKYLQDIDDGSTG